MFGKVKDITKLINSDIVLINEGIQSKLKHDNVKYNNYIDSMILLLEKRLVILTKISSNDKMITKYNNIVNDIVNVMLVSKY